uniref:F-box domain-containing protein n=1 Tax=Aegilops tauschii TaxID=37682 RepID=R7WCG0_AEGTA
MAAAARRKDSKQQVLDGRTRTVKMVMKMNKRKKMVRGAAVFVALAAMAVIVRAIGFTTGVPMELRSGFRCSPPPLPHGARSRHDPDGGVDLISALPDEMLLLVLMRLRCFRAAAQTSLLSRRWRGVWTGLTDLTLCDLKPSAIEVALARFNAAPTRFAASPPVSTVNISFSERYAAHASSLLRATVRLSPEELVFTFQGCHMAERAIIVLPYFRRATSIEPDVHSHRIDPTRECYAGEAVPLRQHHSPWLLAQPWPTPTCDKELFEWAAELCTRDTETSGYQFPPVGAIFYIILPRLWSTCDASPSNKWHSFLYKNTKGHPFRCTGVAQGKIA